MKVYLRSCIELNWFKTDDFKVKLTKFSETEEHNIC